MEMREIKMENEKKTVGLLSLKRENIFVLCFVYILFIFFGVCACVRRARSRVNLTIPPLLSVDYSMFTVVHDVLMPSQSMFDMLFGYHMRCRNDGKSIYQIDKSVFRLSSTDTDRLALSIYISLDRKQFKKHMKVTLFTWDPCWEVSLRKTSKNSQKLSFLFFCISTRLHIVFTTQQLKATFMNEYVERFYFKRGFEHLKIKENCPNKCGMAATKL